MSARDTRRDFLAGRALRRVAERKLNPESERVPPSAGATVRLETRAMACPWSIVLNPGPPDMVMLASNALDLVHPIEQQLSLFRDDSVISQLKRFPIGEWQPFPAEVMKVLQLCQEVTDATGGAFDPTSGPVIRLWRECRQAGRIPATSEILAALPQEPNVEYPLSENDLSSSRRGVSRVVEMNSHDSMIRVRVPAPEIDLGAIGKGYAIDRITDSLCCHQSQDLASNAESASYDISTGISDFLIHGGYSSLRARGCHNGHDGWPVGLRNPLFPDRHYATIILKDQALATSGSNVQFFRHQGIRYGHILDPRTGWPVEGMLSVTVIAPTAAESDALSTAFYVMGLDAAADYCRQHPEIGAILVPPVTEGRTLIPLIINIPEEALYFEDPNEVAAVWDL